MSMPADDRVQSLVSRWLSLHERGQEPSPEQLCSDCPELLPELLRRFELQRRLREPANHSAVASAPRVGLSSVAGLAFQPALVIVAMLVATTVQLHQQGRQWWCACGGWSPWSGDAWGQHNSQHLLDPYSLTHLMHGLLLCGFLAAAMPRLALKWRLTLAVCLECVWEIVENSSFVIARYRAATASLGYQGDTVANSLGDILSCVVGFWLATRLGFRKSLVFFLAVELFLVAWIRDSLTLNLVMLFYPLEAIRAWQMGS
jgi:hypothetical protein